MRTKKRFILPCLTISLFVLLTLTNAFAPVGIASTAYAATYYVDATNGNDPNDGLSPESAWKTIQKVNSMNFNPGDSTLFKRGEVWREQLNVNSSGEEGNPITFGAYGEVITGWSLYDEEKNIYVADVGSEVTQLFVDGHGFYLEGKLEEIDAPGEWYYSGGKVYLCMAEGVHPDNHLIAFAKKPEINGADVITGWSIYEYMEDGSVIYVADVGSEVTQLFVDGKRQTLARWPNSGWLNIDADSAVKTSLYSESLTQADNYWAGATIVVKTKPYKIEVRDVMANNGDTIRWDENTSHIPKKDYGFYLENKLAEIDTKGEWYYDNGARKVYLQWNEDPDNVTVEGSLRDYGVRISWKKQYINVDGFSIKYTSSHGIYITYCSYINIDNNAISFSKGKGIYFLSYPPTTCNHIYITNNSISQTKADGICVRNIDYGEITDNDLTDIASDEVSPKKATAILAQGNTNFTVSGNRIDRVSYIGIHVDSAGNNTVSYNNVSNCLLLLYDGGGIYSWGERSKDLIVKDNIVRDIVGNAEGTPAAQPGAVAGIYLDDLASDFFVGQNIVFNCYYGILLHNTHDITIVNNVFYNNEIAACLSEGYQENYMHDNDFYNNIYVATKEDQLTFKEASWVGQTGIMGHYNNNFHYNPYRENLIRYQRPGNDQFYTLEEWRTVSGQDEYSIAADPLFVDVLNHDFHLQPLSFCIDRGRDVGLTEDFEGNPIVSAPDIGAYEYEVTDYNGCPMPPTSLTVIRISN